jgi:undecaprenyl-diphosphatase
MTVAAVAILMAIWLLMMLQGTGAVDLAVLDMLYSANRPVVRAAASILTLLGQWQSVVLISVIAAAWLLYRRKVRSALLLLAVTLLGRALVELQKVGVHRQRPELEHLVEVRSLSFPSAHSANSMILLLSLALIAAPTGHRRWAVIAALAGTFLVGITRPILGVHWPSDVIGGWSFGAAWVLAMLAVAERWPARERPKR